MPSVSSITLSGLAAATSSLDASAHNLANLGTAGFQRQRVSPDTPGGGGVATRLDRAEQPGNAPETDLVNLLSATHLFQANWAVFKTADQVTGALLDLVA